MNNEQWRTGRFYIDKRDTLATGWVSNLALTRLKSAIYPLYRQPLLSELSGGALETFAHPPRSRCSSPGACANGKRHRNGYIPTLILKNALSGPYES